MNSTAIVIAVAYGIVVVIASVLALAIAGSARKEPHEDAGKLVRRENAWFGVVIVLLLGLLLSTIWLTPYSGGGEASAAGRQVVEVTGRQFAWTVQPQEVKAGRQVEFRIRADDVSHSFALYDPDDRLVFQVQAVPEALQKEFHTLTKPGRYRIVCLEFCGVNHHTMLSQLTVAP